MNKKERMERRRKNEEYQEFFNKFSQEEVQIAKENELNNQIESDIPDKSAEKTFLEKQAEEFSNIKTELILDDLPVSVGFSSVIGKREYQQDSVKIPNDDKLMYKDKPKFLCVLSDGMGGLSGGEIASNIATDTMFDCYYKKVWKKDNVSYLDFFNDVSEKINQKVLELTDKSGEPMRAGATLIAAAVDNDEMHFLNIGDSRIYLVRNGRMLQLTHDQNYLTTLMSKVESGEITQQQALNHPKREALISYCGIKQLKIKEMNLKPLKLMSGDIILMCSDGLYRLLSRQEIIEILHDSTDDMNLAAYKLTAAATDKNFRGQDNTSVILINII